MRMVALDHFLNPKHTEENNMVHLQFAKEYRSMLMMLKKSGFLKHESIPIKPNYTTCVTAAKEVSGKDWSIRIIAGDMTLTVTHNKELIIQHHNIELTDYITNLSINHNSPTLDVVYRHIRAMKLCIDRLDKASTLAAKRDKIKFGNREVFGNITKLTQGI